MPFYSDVTSEPKDLLDITLHYKDHHKIFPDYAVVSVNRPTFQMEGGPEVKYIQHTFKYPGRVMWQDVNVTVLDPGGDRDSSASLMNMLAQSGYEAPLTNDSTALRRSMSKRNSNSAVGLPLIKQINSDGNIVDQWTLHNAFLSQVQFGELNYESDDIVKIQLTFKYDYATFLVSAQSAPQVDTRVASKQVLS